MSKLPQTSEEWQEAVDQATFYLALVAARSYGLITGGPEVDEARCEEILRLGKEQGIAPAPDAVQRYAAAWAGQ
jgi:hypothetical protein